MPQSIRIGTRGSLLALHQTQEAVTLLQAAWPEVIAEIIEIRTTGDRVQDVPLTKIGDKGLFVKEIEEALLAGRIDWAVHSVKDLPSQLPERLRVDMLAHRVDPRDALVARNRLTLTTLPGNAIVGTSSLRRRAQLLHWRPDLHIVPIRGNLDTRLRKLETERLDGIIVAAAGLLRMGWDDRISDIISPEICLPAVGQGALGVELRRDDEKAHALLQPLTSPATQATVIAERSFLARLEGGCQVPIAAWATIERNELLLRGMISDVDGVTLLRAEQRGSVQGPELLGHELAETLLRQGGDVILRAMDRTS